MTLSFRFGKVRAVFLVIAVQWFIFTAAETEDFVKAGQNFLDALQKKLSQQDARLEKIEGMVNVSAKPVYGSKSNSAKSCKAILARYKSAVSGIYWIKITTNSKPFQVYCDMETHRGGWTLVYSYTFTNYSNFRDQSNAITPRPNWQARDTNVPVSTTPPLCESSLGAVNYYSWRFIGEEFMVKSNINDWIVCQPNGGSLVRWWKDGKLSCKNIKNVATACNGVVPNNIIRYSVGPALRASSSSRSQVYKFDGGIGITGDWPVHDPCGKYSTNQKKGVSNPRGQIYLR